MNTNPLLKFWSDDEKKSEVLVEPLPADLVRKCDGNGGTCTQDAAYAALYEQIGNGDKLSKYALLCVNSYIRCTS